MDKQCVIPQTVTVDLNTGDVIREGQQEMSKEQEDAATRFLLHILETA